MKGETMVAGLRSSALGFLVIGDVPRGFAVGAAT